MSLELIEAAVDAVDTYLEANISAKVAELNARYDDDYTLVDPVHWYVGGYPMAVPEPPSVALVAIGWTPEGQRRDNIEGSTRMDIVTFVGGDELEARYRRLCRYALGIMELLKAGGRSTGYAVTIDGPVELSDVMDTPSFLQAITVPVLAGKVEEY